MSISKTTKPPVEQYFATLLEGNIECKAPHLYPDTLFPAYREPAEGIAVGSIGKGRCACDDSTPMRLGDAAPSFLFLCG